MDERAMTRDDADDRAGYDVRSLRASSGAAVHLLESDAGAWLQIADADGRVLIAYDSITGQMTLTAPSGSIALAAPVGDLSLTAGHRLTLRAPEVAVDAGRLCATGDVAEARFNRAEGRFGVLKQQVGRLVQTLGSAYARIDGLYQTIARRRRTLVREDDTVRARDISMTAERDIRADGDHIRLG